MVIYLDTQHKAREAFYCYVGEFMNATYFKQSNFTHNCKDCRLFNEDSDTNFGVHSANIEFPVNDQD